MSAVTPQTISMIDLESLPMWLVTINHCKLFVYESARMELFQREAKAVKSVWLMVASLTTPDWPPPVTL